MTEIERLAELGTAHLSDACRAIDVPVAIAGERLRPLVPFSRLAGHAVTVRFVLLEGSFDDRDQAVRQFEAARDVESPVLVIRNEVPGYDSLGAFDARLALASGFVGCVTDGAIRDTAQLARLLPVFATSIRPDCIRLADLPAGTAIRRDMGGTVEIAGAAVNEGDVIVADNDGLIGFPAARLADVVAGAEAIHAMERDRVARFEAGASLREVLGPS
jgi:regulator of RNase E activity RraA